MTECIKKGRKDERGGVRNKSMGRYKVLEKVINKKIMYDRLYSLSESGLCQSMPIVRSQPVHWKTGADRVPSRLLRRNGYPV